MSSLTFEMRHMKGADLNGESSLPPIAGMINVQQQEKRIWTRTTVCLSVSVLWTVRFPIACRICTIGS